MGKKILVTGGAGNVAGSLVGRLVQNPDYFVVIVDSLRTGALSKLPEETYTNWKFINANVNKYAEIEKIMLEEKFDIVFHYAALVGVKRTLENPLEVLSDIDGIKYILELSKNTGVQRVFYSSSSEVYGEPVEFPQIEETTPLNAKLPYAIVKNVGEAFFKSYYKEHNLPFTIFRFFNTYGPKQSEDFVVAKFLKAAMRNEDIHIYGDGSQSRTFCYVDDNIDTTMSVLENDLGINDTLNVGNDVETTVLELAQACIRKTNSSSKIVHLPALEEGDMTRRQPDITKMANILKRPLLSLEEGLDKMMDYYKSL
jgi:nucleoside-diphosphate-sugar epimerase